MDYKAISSIFRDGVDDNYCHTLSSEIAKKKLIDALTVEDYNLVFLLGHSGHGKSYLIHNLKNSLSGLNIIIQNPIDDELSLLKLLYKSLKGKAYPRLSSSVEDIRAKVMELYKDVKHVVFIDEAQLLDNVVLERIRILSDSRVFKFVLVMHKNEGDEILKRDHFKSRTKKVVCLENLRLIDMCAYVEQKLLLNQAFEISSFFKKRYVRMIDRYTKGNFRNYKKMIRTILEIMEEAKDRGIAKHRRLNSTLIDMAAIDCGLYR